MLYFSVMQDPDVETTRSLDVGGMTEPEWEALFYDSFGCFKGMNEPHIPGEPIEDWDDRVRTKFQSAIPEYPLLGRMWDIYGEYWYPPKEIQSLRDECLRGTCQGV